LDKELTNIGKNTRTSVKTAKADTITLYKKCKEEIHKLTKSSTPRQKMNFRKEATLFCNECQKVLKKMKKGITKADAQKARETFINDYRYLKNAVAQEWAKLTKSAK